MIHIDRDPNNKKLEFDVFSKLDKIYDDIEPKRSKKEKSNLGINFVSVEDAIKELQELGEKIETIN